MPREIKFRGKRRDGKGWLYGNYITYDEDSNLHVFINPPGCYTDNDDHLVFPDTVGQFTGLQDKNGKDIYEGDIYCFENPDAINEVCYCIGGGFAGFDLSPAYTDNNRLTNIEVIGNIHDNPEMLNTSE